MEDNNQRRVIFGIVALALTAVLGWLVLANKNRPPGPAALGVNQPSGSGAAVLPELAELSVPDQFPGDIVYVSRLDLPAGGWLLIRELAASGVSGEIVGQQFFTPSADPRPATISLRQPFLDGQAYIAALYADDGDGIWQAERDLPLADANGRAIAVTFRTTRNLPEQKG